MAIFFFKLEDGQEGAADYVHALVFDISGQIVHGTNGESKSRHPC